MSEYVEINKLLNKATRALDLIARETANFENLPKTDNLLKIAEAISLVGEVQNTVWKEAPELSVHYEGKNKEETRFMREFRTHLKNAYEYEKNNDLNKAKNELNQAIEMELPPLMHETATKFLVKLQKNNN